MAKLVIAFVALITGAACGYFFAKHQALTKEEIRDYFYDQSDVFGKQPCRRLDIDRFTALCTAGSSWIEPIDEATYSKAK